MARYMNSDNQPITQDSQEVQPADAGAREEQEKELGNQLFEFIERGPILVGRDETSKEEHMIAKSLVHRQCCEQIFSFYQNMCKKDE